MRRLLALGCCAAHLAFGLVAAGAHVHPAADHHEEMRGLHLDHVHWGETGHGHTTDHGPANTDEGTRLDARHIGHHGGAALYLSVAAGRSHDSIPRTLPALIVVDAAVEPPATVRMRPSELPCPLRGPPTTGTIPARAPPPA